MSEKKNSAPVVKSNYDLVYEQAGDKEKIMLILLKNEITPKEIVSLTLSNLTENGITIRDIEIPIGFEIIAGYLAAKGKFIKKKAGFLFPSIKQSAPMSESNVALNISLVAKEIGLKLIDLDVPNLVKERKVPEKLSFNSRDELLKWAKTSI